MTKKVAIVHDFFFQYGGAEEVVEKVFELYPNADLYTLAFIPDKVKGLPLVTKSWDEDRVFTTWFQGFFVFRGGLFLRYFKHFFFAYPLAMWFLKVQNYDLVIISSTNCAKNVRLKNNQKIIHYCHTPTRYLYDLVTLEDQQSLSSLQKLLFKILVPPLRFLDQRASLRLKKLNTVWVANSQFVKTLIKEIYQVGSQVIFPPIETTKFANNPRSPHDFYLCHGRISFHKRLDLAIITCLDLGQKLMISGGAASTKELEFLKNIVEIAEQKDEAKKGLIAFLGRTTDEQMLELMSQCKGFIFPGREDFGITPVQMLAGCVPLICYGAGGALEYVENGVNGVLFPEQSVESLMQAIYNFEKIDSWNEEVVRNTASKFDQKYFLEDIKKVCEDA